MVKKKINSSDLYYDYQLCLKMREEEYKNNMMNNIQNSKRMNELIIIEHKIKDEINKLLNKYLPVC